MKNYAISKNVRKNICYPNLCRAKNITNIIPQGYKLDFVDYSDEWLGCWSSMAKGHSSDYLWGVVWELHKSDMELLNVYGSINNRV